MPPEEEDGYLSCSKDVVFRKNLRQTRDALTQQVARVLIDNLFIAMQHHYRFRAQVDHLHLIRREGAKGPRLL